MTKINLIIVFPHKLRFLVFLRPGIVLISIIVKQALHRGWELQRHLTWKDGWNSRKSRVVETSRRDVCTMTVETRHGASFIAIPSSWGGALATTPGSVRILDVPAQILERVPQDDGIGYQRRAMARLYKDVINHVPTYSTDIIQTQCIASLQTTNY